MLISKIGYLVCLTIYRSCKGSRKKKLKIKENILCEKKTEGTNGRHQFPSDYMAWPSVTTKGELYQWYPTYILCTDIFLT